MEAVTPLVRPAGPADAPDLARMRWRFRSALGEAREDEAAFVARCTCWMAERLGAGGAWRCWVADDGGRIVGAIWLARIEKIPNPVAEPEAHGYITNFYVNDDARGTGTGTALLAAALAEADGRGFDAVVLWPTPRSRSLYQRHGFAVRGDVLERRASAAP